MQGRLASFSLAVALASFTPGTATAQGAGSANADHGQNTKLGQQVRRLIADPAVARAHWGVSVTTLGGVPVLGLNEGKLFRPASTAKLFTLAAALALLGPDFRFATRTYGDLDAASGTVRGDLTLMGGGDPSFGTEDLPYRPETPSDPPSALAPGRDTLTRLADELVDAGVKRVTGDIVGDDTLFGASQVPGGWAEEDLLWGYGALPNALSVQDNQLRITVQSAALPGPGESPSVNVNQLYPYLDIRSELRTSPEGADQKSALDVAEITRTPQVLRLFGTVSPKTPALHETVALHDPSAYAAGALRALLQERGVDLAGQARTQHRPPASEPSSYLAELRAPGCEASLWGEGPACPHPCPDPPPSHPMLLEHLSLPLIEDVAFTLKTSANLHAEMLLHQLALRTSCGGVTTLEGARVVRSWLLHSGLQDDEFLLYDGSGLSTKDLVTPHAETKLLAYVAKQPWFPQWLAALPVGGVDGTLASRFTDPFMKGHVFAKTGTLGETRALAGYVRCASGRQLVFSILVDDHEPGGTADRLIMDKVVETIARLN